MMSIEPSQLFEVLKKYFGYLTFRPLQQEIINDLLQGRDAFALLPTGAGKSLCYQLPALLLPGVTVVVSPLIALMKDQVQALQANGVPATFLNSSLDPEQTRERLRGLHQGNYRLLYVSPERLMMPGLLANVKKWNPNLIAIDESHCISEWGHDFRPEYRQLTKLRDSFPEVPIIALTATATLRVRKDIVNLLRLRNPGVYTASFNRPNLIYRVLPKSDPKVQVRDLLSQHKNESGIIYCQSRKTSELLAQQLTMHGFSAAPYHAGLSSEERSTCQDSFLEDDTRIVCATIAFGMGINKADVRFVIHYDLPKNIEGYYQETGRSGRDGLSSDCVLLFSAGDAAKQSHFIEEKQDERERRIAKEQLQQMIHYAEFSGCRRQFLLNYFGEDFPAANCETCDNCISPPDNYDGTLEAQKFLSCIYRIREKSHFGVGANHVIEVLTGADSEKIRRWDHQDLSTYGIGKEHSRKEWSEICRELLRLGLIAQTSGEFQVLEITEKGRSVLKKREPVQLTKRAIAAPKKAKKLLSEKSPDASLFEQLRKLRKSIAEERGVPAFVIFHDSVLEEIAREMPVTLQQFGTIKGVGQHKLQTLGEVFISVVREHRKKG